MSERLYPNLIQDIREAPTVEIVSNNGKPHKVKVFSFSEYRGKICPKLIGEIADGLVEKLENWRGQFDYLVDLMPGGGRWGLLVASECNTSLTTGWVNHGGPLYEKTLPDESRVKVGGPHGRELCFRGINRGNRVMILDDVIATGQTMNDVIKAFKERGVEIVGVLTIVTKGDRYKQIELDFGIPVVALINLDEEGKIMSF